MVLERSTFVIVGVPKHAPLASFRHASQDKADVVYIDGGSGISKH
jgi:hypothetical protein